MILSKKPFTEVCKWQQTSQKNKQRKKQNKTKQNKTYENKENLKNQHSLIVENNQNETIVMQRARHKHPGAGDSNVTSKNNATPLLPIKTEKSINHIKHNIRLGELETKLTT